MFWADRLAEAIEKRFGKPAQPLVIRDEKTVSGRVHVGSMRGVAIHGAVHQALADRGVQSIFRYEFNDFDPMDDIPSYLPRAEYEQYLGMPLRNIPSPEPGFDSFAAYFAAEFRKVIEDSGFNPEFYWGSELYLSGKMDDSIRKALEGAEAIRRIYKEVSGGEREEQWLPLSVMCPTCGKLSTTEASDFDGQTVAVHCNPTKVTWTTGCDFKGRVSPFGGTAKLPWKVEWAAKWRVVGVEVEGAGKDHSTKGGARDVANHISKEVFGYEPPFDMPYEFLLVGGRKMSSSKGRGSSAREIAELVPAKIFRLALLGKDINQQFNFDPEGETIPVLYDQYDKFAENYWTGVKDDYARLFEFLHADGVMPQKQFLFRFSQVAFFVQMPHLNLLDEAAKVKGNALNADEEKEIEERATYAKRWLDLYAPEKYVFKVQENLPEISLTEEQKTHLRSLAELVEKGDFTEEGLKSDFKKITEEVSAQEFYKVLYTVFLGKDSGPVASKFLPALGKEFVLGRLKEAAQ